MVPGQGRSTLDSGARAFHNGFMADSMTEPSSPPPTWRRRLAHPRILAAMLAGIAAGLILAAGGWRWYLRPRREIARIRYDTLQDLMALYALQVAHHKSAGTYADNLDALLADAKDAAALKARLAKHVDLDTVTIVGNAERFKLEANALDGERSLIKVKGPVMPRRASKPPAPLPEPSSAPQDAGAPVRR